MIEKERYSNDWKLYPSVTEVQKDFPSRPLLRWFKSQTKYEIERKSEKGMEIGKVLHELRSKLDEGEPFDIVSQYPEEIKNCIRSYIDWKKSCGIPLKKYREVKMLSQGFGFKGTFDDLAVNQNNTMLLEYKTSKAIYEDHLEQVIAYKLLYESADLVSEPMLDPPEYPIRQVWVIRFAKNEPKFEAHLVTKEEEEMAKADFLNKLLLYKNRDKREALWQKSS